MAERACMRMKDLDACLYVGLCHESKIRGILKSRLKIRESPGFSNDRDIQSPHIERHDDGAATITKSTSPLISTATENGILLEILPKRIEQTAEPQPTMSLFLTEVNLDLSLVDLPDPLAINHGK